MYTLIALLLFLGGLFAIAFAIEWRYGFKTAFIVSLLILIGMGILSLVAGGIRLLLSFIPASIALGGVMLAGIATAFALKWLHPKLKALLRRVA